ncbi:hypothetical protein MUCCIDRAFT_83828 [Mucor lusitanicus CBS 277.49]|uniref:EF-hand domain-containing protein n=1 Tax=Mucor lusitanicus CBS 277.49 TaxID=747725 RepID=A0A168IBZ2_MUCCL|nr:hypothetical protein MUCCIDRAFT_83828 [Mucor lusitanicus CBS 277.49]
MFTFTTSRLLALLLSLLSSILNQMYFEKPVLILSVLLGIAASLVTANVQGEFEQHPSNQVRHMNEAHQIEVTDEVTFFKLHDVDGDGFWDEKELQSMYGLERDIDPNTSHIKKIIDRVYEEMDMNKDRFISMDEYITAKLPSITAREEKLEKEYRKKAPPPPPPAKNSKRDATSGKKAEPVVKNKRSSSKNVEGVIPNKFRA